jgi:hypothetical protein
MLLIRVGSSFLESVPHNIITNVPTIEDELSSITQCVLASRKVPKFNDAPVPGGFFADSKIFDSV